MNEPSEVSVLDSFALDELLCRQAGEGGPAVCHLWRHPRALVLGLRDSRLPQAAEAARQFAAEGFEVVVRHSGGAAVPLDPGVVNLSLILPRPSGASNSGDFHDDFERMYALIAEALSGTGHAVNKGEIGGAYCPGDYDLSIGGFKFCGIAQRRQTKALIVQAFIVAEGSGAGRAGLVREFYRLAAGDADPSRFPQVEEASTASLSELIGIGKGASAVFAQEVKRVLRAGQTEAGLAAAAASLRMPSPEDVRTMAETLRSRYAIL
ncbi:lipoate--protein ligase family protein [Cohnella zeiphila]|nr:lipoate--protein ligase family protein [Cohnella zeiphila]